MINIETATKEELLKELEECNKLWCFYSCDCFGFYIQKIQNKIYELNMA